MRSKWSWPAQRADEPDSSACWSSFLFRASDFFLAFSGLTAFWRTDSNEQGPSQLVVQAEPDPHCQEEPCQLENDPLRSPVSSDLLRYTP